MSAAMTQQFLPVFIHLALVVGVAAFILGGSVLLGRSGRRNPVKDSPYECGVLTSAAHTPRFSVKFYMVAMLFVLFDIEVVFLYPWAVQFRDLIAQSSLVFWSAFSFVGILGIAYAYVLKKGALDWNEG